jgi:hypothetical protein
LADLSVTATVTGLEAVLLDTLPPAPADRGDPGFCPLVMGQPATPAGQAVQAKGWQVTAEFPIGDLTAVSFAGRVTPVTSGACEIMDGNVGVFAGDRLVALVYGTEPDETRIGSLRPFGRHGLRILSGDILPGSVADLTLTGDTLTVTDPAPEEPVCNDRAIVPDIEGLPIDQARRALQAGGWTPVPGSAADRTLGWTEDLAAMGLPEIQDCSGTGFGFCLFAYDHPAATLNVVTVGEPGDDGSLPAVARYWAECREAG